MRILTTEIVEQEEKWINYDEEYTEVNVEISELVFGHLLLEFVNELYTKQ